MLIKIIGIGDNVVDKYLHLNKMFPGGNAVNVAVLAHKYGAQCAYIGCLGSDFAGKHILYSLKSEGIDTSHIKIMDGANSYAKVTIVDGDRVFLPGYKGVSDDIFLTEEDYEYIKGFDLIHTSIYSNLDDILPRIKETGVAIAYDFSGVDEHHDYEKILPYVNYAFFSASELELDEIKKLAIEISEKGPETVLFTRGSRGALLFSNGKYYTQEVISTEVVDTLGAGDSFISRLMVGILGNEKIEEALYNAAKAAAEVCTSLGAYGYGTEIR